MDRILAIITARSGSKGLKHKNIKKINGKPLIAYTIEAAKNSGIFMDIIVSTDSEKYADISKEYGASVPFLRSKELSSDTATSIDVILSVIEKMEELGSIYDYFMLLQPTSPLRTSNNIVEAYDLLKQKNANTVVGVCETEHSPLISNTLDPSLLLDKFLDKAKNMRRQDMPVYYRINGAIYICKVEYFKKYKDFYKEKSYAYIMNKRESVDIDDEIDFKLAEAIMKEKKWKK